MFPKTKKGFTLIELMVVIAIISLLSSIVLAMLNETRAKARDAARIHDLEQIEIALALYWEDYGHYPTGTACYGEHAYYSGGSKEGATCDWSLLANHLQDYIALPDEVSPYELLLYPIGGSTCLPYDDKYGYLYLTNSSGGDYDLIAKLETDHSLRCGLQQWTLNVPLSNPSGWCFVGIDQSICGGASPGNNVYLYSARSEKL